MNRLIWKILLSGCIFLLPCSCQHKRVDYYYTSIVEYVNNCPGPVELKFEGKAAQVPDMLRIESGESKSFGFSSEGPMFPIIGRIEIKSVQSGSIVMHEYSDAGLTNNLCESASYTCSDSAKREKTYRFVFNPDFFSATGE